MAPRVLAAMALALALPARALLDHPSEVLEDPGCLANYNDVSGLMKNYDLTQQQIIDISFWGELSVAMSHMAAIPQHDGMQVRKKEYLHRARIDQAVAELKTLHAANQGRKRLGGQQGAPREKICIVTSVVDKCDALASVTLPNKRAYAEKHGYQFSPLTNDDERPGCPTVSGRCRNAHYLKFSIILKEFEKDDGACDWVFWADGDALFLDMDVPLEVFTSGLLADNGKAHNGTDLILSWWEGDRSGMMHKVRAMKQLKVRPSDLQDRQVHQLNSGHFFVRNSEWSKKWLLEAAQLTKREHYHYWNDQGNMADLIMRRGIKDATHYTFYPVRAFNSFYPGDWHENDFIVHANGACRQKGKVGRYMAECGDTTGAMHGPPGSD